MDAPQLLFWKAGPTVKLTAREIARELLWGEEVDGLIDLPVREIIDRLKAEFTPHDEKLGALIAHGETGSFEATWTWQHVRVNCQELSAADRERLIEAIESFDCMAFDANAPGP